MGSLRYADRTIPEMFIYVKFMFIGDDFVACDWEVV